MNRVVLVTGSRKGLGLQLCKFFLAQGDFVYGCSRRKGSIEHNNYVHFSLDVSNEIDVVDMVRQIYKTHKRVDILINNAGAASMNHFLLTPYSTAQKLMNTNMIVRKEYLIK